jgi:hypothetical protein
MKTRNFYILVSSIIVGMVIAWLFIYTVITLDVDLFQDPNKITIRGNGVDRELTLSINELKSSKYDQIIDKTFHIKKGPPSYSEYDIKYSGVSLWSILEVENLISENASLLKFQFKGRDLYVSPKFLNLSIVKNNPELAILAYEKSGDPLSLAEGPLRSVLDQTIIPNGEYSSQYSVQKLSDIIINYY